MADQKNPLIKREFKFDLIYFIAVIFDGSARELLAREMLGPDDLAKLTNGLVKIGAMKRQLASI
jgi:hypothetical protein